MVTAGRVWAGFERRAGHGHVWQTHPMSFRGTAVVAGLAVLVLHACGTAVAVWANWPAQLGAVGTDAAAEWMTRGTALSAPLAPLVALVVAVVLASLPGWLNRVGGALVVLLSLLFMVAALGEAFAPATPDVPKGVLVASGVVGVLTAAAVSLVVLRAGAPWRRALSPPSGSVT
jgi:hypothetical protein